MHRRVRRVRAGKGHHLMSIRMNKNVSYSKATTRKLRDDPFSAIYVGTLTGSHQKLAWHNSSQNEVGIAVCGSLESKITTVERISDRLINVKIGEKLFDNHYAPKAGKKEEENMFWQELVDYTVLPQDEVLLLEADLSLMWRKKEINIGKCKKREPWIRDMQ
ncbi:unnamed protein product [Strongylus vulgaris]|uniref:Uncharacterized protein n=1 Tax=Strongylus vulgaris TaxID=40348 RepID=A0A3P7IHG6_STRVU|nr:unnamed protein product [Strongylus vulgaris]